MDVPWLFTHPLTEDALDLRAHYAVRLEHPAGVARVGRNPRTGEFLAHWTPWHNPVDLSLTGESLFAALQSLDENASWTASTRISLRTSEVPLPKWLCTPVKGGEELWIVHTTPTQRVAFRLVATPTGTLQPTTSLAEWIDEADDGQIEARADFHVRSLLRRMAKVASDE